MGSHDLTHHREYIKSRCWACDKSPTGAHHWVERCGLWICKWCLDVRKFTMIYQRSVYEERSNPNPPRVDSEWAILPQFNPKFQL